VEPEELSEVSENRGPLRKLLDLRLPRPSPNESVCEKQVSAVSFFSFLNESYVILMTKQVWGEVTVFPREFSYGKVLK